MNNFFSLDCKTPPNHQKTPTEDGTFTLESSLFSENCHSTAGAYEETLFNYVHGTELNNKLSYPEINIFEVGFGLGIGPIATFNELKDYPGQINFYSGELDEDLVKWFKNSINDQAKDLFPFHCLEKNLSASGLTSYLHETENRRLEIFIGDFIAMKDILKGQLSNIHAVYQDPFSPKKNPELWSIDWFSFLKDISNSNVILSTYSASHSVQKNMASAGWNVLITPGFAHKRSSTRGTLNNNIYKGPLK